ncbi:hypothetical protein F511_36057 [Dorcoceras hygrometricum]|uniref:Uncharacterized protein n=1 Tax=Dorcoceras hygrometricum TaxID=472368 RepID=A0A2Z7BI39_9LAMI|nr:hypothetical protein F511_36057 [Dorcoceras hygrometricum]
MVSLESCTCWFLAQNYLLNLSTKAKRCRINLFKRHRFAIANSKYHLLLPAYCDDITDDVIIADSRSCASSQLLIVMTSSLLLIASSRIYADVITADS